MEAQSGLAEPDCHVAAEILIELIQCGAKGHRQRGLERLVRPQRKQQLADPFSTVLNSDEIEHRVSPMAVDRGKVQKRRDRATAAAARVRRSSAAHMPR